MSWPDDLHLLNEPEGWQHLGQELQRALLEEEGTKDISETNEETTSRSLIIFHGNLCSNETEETEKKPM